jgi:hypothetical protein
MMNHNNNNNMEENDHIRIDMTFEHELYNVFGPRVVESLSRLIRRNPTPTLQQIFRNIETVYHEFSQQRGTIHGNIIKIFLTKINGVSGPTLEGTFTQNNFLVYDTISRSLLQQPVILETSSSLSFELI